MVNKSLLYGMAGFILGGLVVSIAATTFDKNDSALKKSTSSKTSVKSESMSSMSMDDMTANLKGKTGDEYDKAFITNMISHHQGAVAMAKLSASSAKHDEIRQLSSDIITAQQKEIAEMKQWQTDWGYVALPSMEGMHH